MAGDHDVISLGLGNACCDSADADLGNELDRNRCGRIDVLQIMDELRQILDGVNIVVRRRGNQGYARH